MRAFWSGATAIAGRNLRTNVRRPALVIAPIVIPLVFFATFGGGLSALGRAPNFDFPSGYTSFQFVFVFLQGSLFQGMFGAFTLARDFEVGFAQRLMLATPQRRSIVAGYLLSTLGRWAVGALVLFTVGFAVGMRVDGSVLEMVLLVGVGAIVSAVGTLWGSGIALRFRTMQAGPLMQVPVFLSIFLAPTFVPLALLTGWIKGVARVNPFTVFLEGGRDYIAGTAPNTLLTYGVGVGLIAFMTVWSLLGLRRAERAA